MKIEVSVEGDYKESQLSNLKLLTIGKGKACDLIIKSEEVSRKHLEVSEESGKIYITDLGSTNGTWIDEEILVPGKKLEVHPFLSIRLGKSVHLTFSIEDHKEEVESTPVVEVKIEKKFKRNISRNTAKSKTKETFLVLILGMILLGGVAYFNESEEIPVPLAVTTVTPKQSVPSRKTPEVLSLESLKLILSKSSCSSEREKMICLMIPGSQVNAVESKIYIQVQSLPYLEEVRNITGQKDLSWRVISALFLLEGISGDFNYAAVKDDQLFFILSQGKGTEMSGAIISLKAEDLENLKVVLNRRRIEAVKDHGPKALKFTEDYFQVTKFSFN